MVFKAFNERKPYKRITPSMGVIVSCRSKNKQEPGEEVVPDDPSPDPDSVLSPANTTNDFIRPLENPYPPLPPVDDVEYGPGSAASVVDGIQRPKTYAVVVSRLAGHRWLKLKLEPRDRTEENQVDQIQED